MSAPYLSSQQLACVSSAVAAVSAAHVDLSVAEDGAEDGADFDAALILFACRRHLDSVLHSLDALAGFDPVEAAWSVNLESVEELAF